MRRLPGLLAVLVLEASLGAQSVHLVPEEYDTPQEAVDAAIDGDTVSVGPGTYVGSTRILGKAVHLVSREGPSATILDGAGSQVLYISNGVGVTSIVRGFTLQHGLAYEGGGIRVSYCSPYIVNCIVRDNSAAYGGGILMQGGGATVVNCLFEGNVAAVDGAAAMTGWAVEGVVLSNCTIVDNWLQNTFSGSIVWFNPGGQALFTNGIVYDNREETQFGAFAVSGGTIQNSNLEFWTAPLGVLSTDPLFVDPELGDYRLQLASPSRDTGADADLPPDVADLDGDGDVTEPVPLDLDGNPRSLDTSVDMGCYEADATPTVYCTAKLNSCGALPSIGFAGLPSATASSGFTVAVQGTRAGRPGLLVYTEGGPAVLPWGGSVLCLAFPHRRSVLLSETAGTPGLCDGTLSIDLNAFAAGALGGNPAPFLLVPGTQVNVQFWARDAPGHVLLSDALEYWVNP